MNIGLQKTSLVNFPGRVAAAVFLPGCNLRCPFCHNGHLAVSSVVSGPRPNTNDDNLYPPLEDAYAHLDKRSGVLSGLAISGGEPLLSPALSDLIRKARSLGLAVKIDTNGTLPDRLAAILEDDNLRPDMISVDIKTSPDRYGELTIERDASNFAGAALLRSLSILRHESEKGRLRVEYRTVLIPGLVGETEIREIAHLIPREADWQLAPFMPGVCLDPSWNDIKPYSPAETQKLLALAKSFIPETKFR
jgi:pyruvate formate lyase activating enzyme